MKNSKKSKKNKIANNAIILNKKARFNYVIEQEYEVGLVLEGWEVKSLRVGKGQISESYVIFNGGEMFLFGAVISPIISTSSHYQVNNSRTRKLLLHRKEIDSLTTLAARDNYTCVPLSIYWSKGKVKVKIGLAKGKKAYDKRQTIKERDWSRDKARIMKKYNH